MASDYYMKVDNSGFLLRFFYLFDAERERAHAHKLGRGRGMRMVLVPRNPAAENLARPGEAGQSCGKQPEG